MGGSLNGLILLHMSVLQTRATPHPASCIMLQLLTASTSQSLVRQTDPSCMHRLGSNAINPQNKKLSCRRQTARCFVSLNISLSHSRSLRSLKLVPFERWVNYGLRFAFHSNYGHIISGIKRDTGRKSRFFHTPPAFDVPVRWGVPSEY